MSRNRRLESILTGTACLVHVVAVGIYVRHLSGYATKGGLLGFSAIRYRSASHSFARSSTMSLPS
jgi:hypothetical protein